MTEPLINQGKVREKLAAGIGPRIETSGRLCADAERVRSGQGCAVGTFGVDRGDYFGTRALSFQPDHGAQVDLGRSLSPNQVIERLGRPSCRALAEGHMEGCPDWRPPINININNLDALRVWGRQQAAVQLGVRGAPVGNKSATEKYNGRMRRRNARNRQGSRRD